MVILNSKKVIFIHIPKSGGSSITEFADKFISWDDIVIGTTDIGELLQGYWALRHGVSKHSVSAHLKAMMGKERYESYCKFVVVREPYERFLSAFNFLVTKRELKAKWLLDSMDYTHIKNMHRPNQMLDSIYFQEIQHKCVADCSEVELFFKAQSSFVDTDEFLKRRFKIFKIEDLNEDIRPLCDFLGVQCYEKLPHANHTDLATNYDDLCLRKSIHKIYKSDYEFQSYKIR